MRRLWRVYGLYRSPAHRNILVAKLRRFVADQVGLWRGIRLRASTQPALSRSAQSALGSLHRQRDSSSMRLAELPVARFSGRSEATGSRAHRVPEVRRVEHRASLERQAWREFLHSGWHSTLPL